MKKLVSNKGFTLVELMVVVGIIGILATIAIPNFRKYQAKSKTTEAKIQLSSAYTAEESALLEYDTYVACLSTVGFNPSPDFANRFYAIGFDNTTGALVNAGSPNKRASDNGLTACISSLAACTSATCTGNHWVFAAGKKPSGVNTAVATVGTTTLSDSAFTLQASGKISAVGTDTWEMNSAKKMIHKSVGY